MTNIAWFGARPDNHDGPEIPTPVGQLCGECNRPIEGGQPGLAPLGLHHNRRIPFHLECWRDMLLQGHARD